MKGRLFAGMAVMVLLVSTGCAASLPAGGSGSVALRPFFNRDWGISGVVPATCSESAPGNFECRDLVDGSLAVMVQQAYPGPRGELVGVVLEQISLERLPEPAGRFKGRAFEWDLYSLEAQVKAAGPEAMRVELALAEDGRVSYLVGLVTPPEAYDAHPALYDSILAHAVYGLVPWE